MRSISILLRFCSYLVYTMYMSQIWTSEPAMSKWAKISYIFISGLPNWAKHSYLYSVSEPDMRFWLTCSYLFISGSYLSFLAQLIGDIGFWISKNGRCINTNSGIFKDIGSKTKFWNNNHVQIWVFFQNNLNSEW